jgi:polysaccharide export outer membrane protein
MFRTIKALAASLAIAFMSGAVAGEAQTAAPELVGPDYVIGPGDTIRVDVWQNPELSMESIPVLPDGRFSTPLVRDIVAVGKTSTQLAKEIETRLAEYVRMPQVTVTVIHAASAFSQVKVIGQVRQPQALAYREGMTVLDAILAAGGLAEFAAPNRTKLIRTEDGKQKEIRLRLGRLLNDGDMSQNLALRPGDLLLVPESRF